MKKTIITGLFLLTIGSVQAQQRAWTLQECVDYAIENNIEIRQQELTVENSELDLNTAQNSRLPSLSASVGQNFNFGRSQNMATGVYEANKSASTSIGASSSMPIFQGMRINRQIESNELDLQASMEGLKKAKENLGLQVATYYLDALFKKELLGVAEEQVGLTQLQVERTRTLVEAGKVPLSQQYEIEATLARNELTLTTAKNDLDLSRLNLSQLLNLADWESFDVVEPEMGDNVIAANRASLVSPEYIYHQALDIKPHVREAEYRLESSEKSVKIAESSRYPSVNLGLSYSSGYSYIFNREGEAKMDPFFDQIKNNQRQSVGLSMSIPIFNRMQTRNQVRAAQLTRENRALELDNVKLALYKEIQQAHQSAIAAEAKYTSTEKAFQASSTALDYARERYEVGKMTVYEFSEAQMQMISSRSEQLQAKYDFLFRAKVLDFYRGEEIVIF